MCSVGYAGCQNPVMQQQQQQQQKAVKTSKVEF
jgi:hypothetical protein